MSPKLSILTSCYNDGATLLRSLRASLAQTEPDIEVIVVNNGSTDETALVMSTLIDPRVRTLTIPEGGSHPAAINRMMEMARAPWAMIVNADDWIEADYVAAVLDAAAQDDRINCVYAPLQCFGAFHHVIDFPPFAASACAEVHMVPGPRAFLSDLWHFMGGEDERWPIGADWDWVVRAAVLGLLHPVKLARPMYHYYAPPLDRPRLSQQGVDNFPALQRHMRAHTPETARLTRAVA